MDSDLGQTAYMEPVSGLQKFTQVLVNLCGVTEDQLRVMLIDNPAKLIGLAED